jgi:hypothetical protein
VPGSSYNHITAAYKITATWGTCYTNVDLIAFHRGGLGGSTLGVAGVCPDSGTGPFYHAQVAMNSNKTWYKLQDPDGIVKDEYDLQSVVLHELGHASGTWSPRVSSHFTNTSMCPGSAQDPPVPSQADQTMCPVYFDNRVYWRSLEDHDSHTLANNY